MKKNRKPFLKGKKAGYIFSPVKLTIGLLVAWVVGMIVGISITNVINAYLVDLSETFKYISIALAFVLVSTLIAFPIAFFITKNGMATINEINSSLNKIAGGDFTTQLNLVTKNPQIDTVVENFNKMVNYLNSVAVLKNDFISAFSHEFRTPIVLIKGYSELLGEGENLTLEQREYLRIIIEECKRLSNLSENSMLLAKLDSQTFIPNKTSFSLDAQIEDCILLIDSVLKEKKIELETHLIKATIKSSPDLIKEVWINLLSNALKFTERGGKIIIDLTEDDKNYIISVEDNGVGMSEEVCLNAFEKFYQADKTHSIKGLGVGLTIVKKIVDLVGGQITCESESNKGTKMTVILKKE